MCIDWLPAQCQCRRGAEIFVHPGFHLPARGAVENVSEMFMEINVTGRRNDLLLAASLEDLTSMNWPAPRPPRPATDKILVHPGFHVAWPRCESCQRDDQRLKEYERKIDIPLAGVAGGNSNQWKLVLFLPARPATDKVLIHPRFHLGLLVAL